jgi:hypothetical protein
MQFSSLSKETTGFGSLTIWRITGHGIVWGITAMAEQSKHISSSFDAALYGLKNVLMMSSLTDRMFQAAVEVLLQS